MCYFFEHVMFSCVNVKFVRPCVQRSLASPRVSVLSCRISFVSFIPASLWPPRVFLPCGLQSVLVWSECLSVILFRRRHPTLSTGAALLDVSLARCPDALYLPHRPVCVIALGGRTQQSKSSSCRAHSGRGGLWMKCWRLGVPADGRW